MHHESSPVEVPRTLLLLRRHRGIRLRRSCACRRQTAPKNQLRQHDIYRDTPADVDSSDASLFPAVELKLNYVS